MTAQTKTRGTQLLKTEEAGTIRRFFRRDTGAFVGAFDVAKLPQDALYRAAAHGLTQNILDSSNKLDGQTRCDHVARQCEIVQAGGWASAPQEVNIDAAKAKMIAALIATGRTPEEAASMVAGLGI